MFGHFFQNSKLFHWYKKIVDYKNATKLREFFNDVGKTISNVVKNWHGFEMIATKLASIPDHVHDSMHEVYSPKENGFNVITHGDMFLNNILFRYNQNGQPIDIRLVSAVAISEWCFICTFKCASNELKSIFFVCLCYRLTFQLVSTQVRQSI